MNQMAAISFIGKSFINAKIKNREILRNDSKCHIYENKQSKIKPEAALRFELFSSDIIVYAAHAKSHSE